MSYVAEVFENLKAKHPNEPEFLEAAERILSSLDPIVEKNEDLYRKNALLERFVEPERIITFRKHLLIKKSGCQDRLRPLS